MNEKTLVMLQHIPRWRDDAGKLVTPNQVLATAAELLDVLAANLDAEEHEKSRAAVGNAAEFLRLIAETSKERKISGVAQA